MCEFEEKMLREIPTLTRSVIIPGQAALYKQGSINIRE